MRAGTKFATGRRHIIVFALLAFVLMTASCLKMAVPSRAQYRDLGDIAEDNSSRAPRAVNFKLASAAEPETPFPRKIIRNASLEMLVNDVGQSITKITAIVSKSGGYVEKSTQSNSSGHSATVIVRVPAASLDPVMTEVKGLATTVDRESVEARDVTREYVDLDARLRNAQAEEAQYLLILKRANTIKDTLDVTEKLSDVRGRIEQMQGEMKLLTAQIDMSSLEIALRAESDAAVAGIHWRPLRQAKIAAGEMLSGLTDWADSVIAFVINLPLIAVWLVSIVVLVIVAVRIIRFLWRKFGPKTSWRMPWRRSTVRDDSGTPPQAAKN